jgi:hypothetical protein
MPRGVMTHGTEDIGDGLATSRQDGPEPQHKAPVIRWSGKRRLKHTQYWHSTIW